MGNREVVILEGNKLIIRIAAGAPGDVHDIPDGNAGRQSRVLQDKVKRRLLDTWREAGGSTDCPGATRGRSLPCSPETINTTVVNEEQRI